MQNALVIGGSRFVGSYVIDLLLEKGHHITVFNRGKISISYPGGVKFVKGDRNFGFPTLGHFDAVIDMCAYNSIQTKQALKELDFDFFIHMSTAAVYKKPEQFPIDENSPLGFWPLWGDYNRGKVECEEILEKSGVAYASIRPVYILGPKNYLDRETFIYSRLKSDEPIIIPGDGRAKVQFVFAREVASAIMLILEKRAEGAYNIAGDDVTTLRDLVETMARISGFRPRIRYDRAADGEHFKPQEFPFANEPFWVKNEKIKSLGIRFDSLEKTLAEDYDKYYKIL